jgi:hypothetical protein
LTYQNKVEAPLLEAVRAPLVRVSDADFVTLLFQEFPIAVEILAVFVHQQEM